MRPKSAILLTLTVLTLGAAAYFAFKSNTPPNPPAAADSTPEPIDPATARANAEKLLEQNRPDKAADLLIAACAANPRDAALHLETAHLLAQLPRRIDQASTHFDRATALAPKAADFRDWAVMLISAGRASRAATVIKQAIELEPANAEYQMQLGRALREQGEGSAAIKAFTKALDLDRKYIPIYLETAATLLALGNEPGAEKFLRDALVIDRNHIPAKLELARLLITASDPARRNLWDAATLLRQASDATQGNDLSVVAAYADVLHRLDLTDQALEQIDTALAGHQKKGLAPSHREGLLRLQQKYRIAMLPPFPEGDGSFLSVIGLDFDENPAEERWPDPVQPGVSKLIHLPLDISRPSGPGTALDPEIYITALKEPLGMHAGPFK